MSYLWRILTAMRMTIDTFHTDTLSGNRQLFRQAFHQRHAGVIAAFRPEADGLTFHVKGVYTDSLLFPHIFIITPLELLHLSKILWRRECAA